MSDDTKSNAPETSEPATPETDGEAPQSDAPAETPWGGLDGDISDPMTAANLALKAADERITELEAEAADARDRTLRAVAEMENLRRRTEREVRDAREYAIARFATDVLSVGDNLRRALETVTSDVRGESGSVVDGFVTGVEMTEREFLAVLERNKVVRFDPMGEKFDPNAHQAMFEVPDPNTPSGTVVQVVQAGYKLGDRVLRPAFVGVAKGGPKAAPAEMEATQTEEPTVSEAPQAETAPEAPSEAGSTVDKTA